MSDHKSRTFLSIQTHLNAVVWMVFPHPLISKSSSFFSKLLGIVQVHQLQSVSPSPSIVFFKFSDKVSFSFILFSLGHPSGQPKPLFSRFLFCSLSLILQPRLGDLFVSQNSREFSASHSLRQIHILFVCWVKFQFFALFSMDHLLHPVISSLILFLH